MITTFETGLSDWEQGGGLLVHPRVEDLTGALETVFSWTESERADRGRALRQLVEEPVFLGGGGAAVAGTLWGALSKGGGFVLDPGT